jgi:ABC-2 type transport system ATP-binding protein
MSNNGFVIETTSLTKQFGRRTAVEDVDLTVPRGCAFGLLGHNGAGKTTLIRMLVGLIAPDRGQVRVLGRDVRAEPRATLARVGAVVERPGLHDHLTGRENLRIVAAVRGPRAMAAIDGALERVGLTERAHDRVHGYSQGMRQRLGLARCLLADPELLILDEPTNGLDPHGIHEIRGIVAGLVGEGRTVLVSSHLLDEIEKTCQAAAVIDNGRLIAQGPIGSLLRGAYPEFEVGCDRPVADLLTGHPAVVDVRPVPDGVRLRLRDPAAISEINALLVGSGVVVTRVTPVTSSLEERFLQHTTKIGKPR